ncbi:putative cytosolic iron-sulfur protein assembly protein Ciao1 [Babesia sp. Xinjiang]|uniref:putative cytosolic iron-sulfur protein assembly protein Ciao1 n=1 Tax=Babesia sp. Xinjiang TaxID=462227 RepID=UPI000A261926|nr:putative cytosolic iron-sulfur protein assembly protein Ciao1 [Babesia sp. Xinjiang]ORM42247.1 putative cytosolic iron-sulfur protein assembly protein Ciao1 [Babesia sp. Xinjiang]
MCLVLYFDVSMSVDDLVESLGGLRLGTSGTFQSDHGEKYVVDPNTGDVFIKGSQRKDGTFRRAIRVRSGYIPQDERASYVPRFRREPHLAQASTLETTAGPSESRLEGVSRKDSQHRSVATGSDVVLDSDGSGRSRLSRANKDIKVAVTSESNIGSVLSSTSESNKTSSTVTPGETAATAKKLINAIRRTRQRLRAAESANVAVEDPLLLPSKSSSVDALTNKLKRLELALSELKVGNSGSNNTDATPSKSFRDVKSVIKLDGYLNKKVYVKFSGGREVQGVLKGHDVMSNLVLDETEEFLRDPNDPDRMTEKTRHLGLLVARGTSPSWSVIISDTLFFSVMEVQHIGCVKGHSERIWSVCWSPVDDVFATSSSDCSVRIWRVNRRKEKVTSLSQPCASYDADCCSDYEIVLEAVIDNYFKKTVRNVRFSVDGEYLICASFEGTATIWSRQHRDELPMVSSSSESASDHIFSTVVSGNHKWVCVCVLEGHENEVKCAAFDCTTTYVATCGRDKTIWIHQRSQGVVDDESYDIVRLPNGGVKGSLEFYCTAILTDHSQDVKCVCWSPKALLLASASYDNTIRLWGLVRQDWVCIQTISINSSTVWCVSFDVNGTRFAASSADCSVSVFKSVKAGDYLDHLRALQHNVGCSSAFMKLGPLDTALSHGLFRKSHMVLDYQLKNPLIADDWQPCHVIHSYHTRPVYSVDFHRFVLTGGGDNMVKIMCPDAESRESRIEFQAHSSDVNAVSWNRHSFDKFFASVGDDEYIKLWKTTMSGILCKLFYPGFVPALQAKILSLPLPDRVKSIIVHPAGPMTIHFYAPTFKWGISIANLSDINRPTDKMSLPQQLDDKEKAEALLSFQKAVQSQKLTLKMLGVCFERCVSTPGEVLTTSQQACLWRCAQRNVETQYFILKRLEGMASAMKTGQE